MGDGLHERERVPKAVDKARKKPNKNKTCVQLREHENVMLCVGNRTDKPQAADV
jgi:hypothetical protein